MSNLLLVPINLDALVLSEDKVVVGPLADFSRLPYCTGTQDLNPDVANISEEILSTPFDNQNLLLKKGIHLHWALPDALTRATHKDGMQDFPTVPNRWLITRNAVGEKPSRWIVESDFLAKTEGADNAGSVTVPYREDLQQPFRYMGRRLELRNWRESAANVNLKLTALGYGEPSFAAFYPNCHSVFGFHDPDYSDPAAELQYEVIGWYSKPEQDCLRMFLASRTSKSNDAMRKDLESDLKWAISITGGKQFPDQMICYARLAFDKGQSDKKNDNQAKRSAPTVTVGSTATSKDDQLKPGVAVGNTGTEALSAYLAHTIDNTTDKSEKQNIEDQLEALQLSVRLEHRQLDVGSKFVEARH